MSRHLNISEHSRLHRSELFVRNPNTYQVNIYNETLHPTENVEANDKLRSRA